MSSNKEAGGVVHQLVSALPLTQMRRLPLNSCSLNEESYTALGTHTLTQTTGAAGTTTATSTTVTTHCDTATSACSTSTVLV